MVSSNGTFEMGFFNPGNSQNRYLGIWYKNIPDRKIVWVANREIPLITSSGVLKVIESALLVLVNDTNGTIVWSSTASRSVENSIAQLLDSGNLVIRDASDEKPENYLWQSFDYFADTYLAGMKCRWNLATGLETYVLSWRSEDDLAPGEFKVHLDPTGYPQLLLKRGTTVLHRAGPWDGMGFSGGPFSRKDPRYSLTLVMNKNEVSFSRSQSDSSVISISKLSPTGVVQRLTWVNRTQSWVLSQNWPADNCDMYNSCGAYGICSISNSPSCGCLERFLPKDEDGWNRGDWSNGSIRRANLSCHGDVFLKYSGIKMPDARQSWYNESMTLEECKVECLGNCSCTAYTQLDISDGGSRCLLYFGDLVDIRNRRKNHAKDSELPLFKLSTILKATNNFSINNKLGEGGFGPVYKGVLNDGREIAVKRLSKSSMQGLSEFTNKRLLIAKLQHRNLVRLLGCCIHEEENMLIYEYMPNKSLDVILYDQTKCGLLNWSKRFEIINGVARGLLYLHQDSRLRIIHRDLKTSNILLDSDMNPKISDFGMARSFTGNESESKTHRVVGTYGYMSPEYAVHGIFSQKSDVFSFGVILLELVSGKRITAYCSDEHNLNLLGYAWRLYKEDRSQELVDPSLGNSFDVSEALRSIHVGLLCVQRCPEDRPNMSSAVFMLRNEVALPEAKHP